MMRIDAVLPGIKTHHEKIFDCGWWARPNLNRSLSVPNAQGWAKLPYGPAGEENGHTAMSIYSFPNPGTVMFRAHDPFVQF